MLRYLIIGLMLMSGCTRVAWACQIPEKQAILAIIGEAEGESYTGKVAVACALRNRGTLKGVYGLVSPRVQKRLFNETTYREAKKAWQESERKDITLKATHWENIETFGKPRWTKGMIKTVKIGRHTFYRKN